MRKNCSQPLATTCTIRFQLSHIAGLDRKAFDARNGSQAADEKLAANHHNGDPWLHDAGSKSTSEMNAAEIIQLVGQWIEQHAHGR